MTSSVKKDTGSFFAHGNSKQFDYVLKLYPEVLQLKAFTRCKKPEELIRLDDWYVSQTIHVLFLLCLLNTMNFVFSETDV